jgi:perosamine synthetase
MSNLQAALGLAQLERIDELLARKRWINERYRNNLKGLNAVRVSTELPGCRSIHWMTSVEVVGVDQERRTAIMREMKHLGVDNRPVFSPMSSMPMFERRADNPVAYRLGQSTINLPSGHNLSQDAIDYVSEVVARVCRQ